MTETQKEPPPKFRLLRTISLFITFSALGVQVVLGPTMPDVEILFNTDTKTLGICFISGNIGFISGVVVSGLVIDRFNQELIFGLAGILGAVVIGASPWMGSVVAFIVLSGVASFSNGLCDSGGQPYILGLWFGTKWLEPLTQMVHFGWSVGSTIAPLMVQPFLLKDLPDPERHTFNNSATSNASLVDHFHNKSRDNATDTVPTTNVQYSYMVISAYVFVASLFSIFIFFLAGPSLKSLPFVRRPSSKKNTKEKWSVLVFTLLMSALFGLYVALELTYGGLITSFAVKGLGWSNKRGTFITAVYWGSFGLARIVAVPLALVASPRAMVNCAYIFINASLLVMLFTVHMHEAVIWSATAAFGFCMGPMFASLLLFSSRYMVITGRVSSILFIGNTLGALVFPPLTAFLFQTYGHMCLIYVCLFLSVSTLTFFIMLQIFAAKLLNPVTESEKDSVEMEDLGQREKMLWSSENSPASKTVET